MSKVMRQMPAPAGRAGVAHGEAVGDPASDETCGPRHDTEQRQRNLVMQTIDLHVQRIFAQALQLDPLQLRLEAVKIKVPSPIWLAK